MSVDWVAPLLKPYDPIAHGAHCSKCPLSKSRSPDAVVVPPEPCDSRKLRLVIVGEGPGQAEEKLLRPFIGKSGQLLNGQLNRNRVQRDECHVTNAALCRGESDKDNEEAARCCAPRLLRELAALDPLIPILTLGKTALISVLGTKKLLYARGFVWTAPEIELAHVKGAERAVLRLDPGVRRDIAEVKAETLRWRSKLAGRTVYPVLHPAFILKADTWKPLFEIDLRRACKGASELSDRGPYETSQGRSLAEVRKMLRSLGPDISFDIETDGVKPLETRILCAGFANPAGECVVLWPWKRAYGPLLTKWFKSLNTLTAHNGYGFDQIVMGQHGVDFTHAPLEDTLIAHHTYASHFPQRLDQIASEYLDCSPWKIRFGRRGAEEKGALPKDMHPSELTLYNSYDCRITARGWARLQGDLESEMAVYEADKALAVVCQSMMKTGIGIDHAEKEKISRHLKARCAALKGAMRTILKDPGFKPRNHPAVRHALFKRLRVKKFATLTKTGLPSTSNQTLELLRGDTRAGRFASLLLDFRIADKVRSTYVGGTSSHPLEFDREWLVASTGRAHFNWKSFGTVSGRLSSRFQSVPRYQLRDKDTKKLTPENWVRRMYVPRKGNVFVYFDVSQAEMRLAAYLSADPVFMKACEGDVHANNAKHVFPEPAEMGWLDGDPRCRVCKLKVSERPDDCTCPKKDPERGKTFRDISKNLGFAIAYGAEAEKVFSTLLSKGFKVTFRGIEKVLMLLRAAYRKYYAYVDRNVMMVRKLGYMRTEILGRIRWLGWFPKPTDVSNFPVQSALADIMNLRMCAMAGSLSSAWRPDISSRVTLSATRKLPKQAELVAQVHDSCVYDCPPEAADEVEGIIKESWAAPVHLPGGPLVLPIDLKRGERLSDF